MQKDCSNNSIKISIITVSYNSAATILDTFASVLSQTYKNIEYIVVDGDSSDSTVDFIKDYESKFGGRMKWISEPDKGLYDAMNKGIHMSTGDVVGTLNSDDLFCNKDVIKKVACSFIGNKDIDAVYADLFYVSRYNTDIIKRKWISGKQRSFKYGWHPAHPTFYVKKEVYIKYGAFNLDFQLASDFEIMLRFIEKYKIKTLYVKEPLVKMRLGGKTNENLKNILKQNIECILAFKVNNIYVMSFLYPIFRIIPKFIQFKK